MNKQQLQEFINKTSLSGSILGMESIVHLCEELGNPQEKQQVIHIAGTNGKGSTGILLQNALMACGLKVGRFSSPAVFAYEEMFQIQGENISDKRLQEIYESVKNACERMVQKGLPHPTIFEVETAAAYLYFYEEKCDYSIIEVGMGGRTDATNVVKKPIISVITSISIDHVAFLGETLEEIASVKAGIIKEKVPVVMLKQLEPAEKVLLAEAKEKQAPAYIADPEQTKVYDFSPDGMSLSVFEGEKIETSLAGYVQIQNVTLARTVLNLLAEKNTMIDTENILFGIKNTRWPGRFESLSKKPRIILDGAHNADAAMQLAKTIETFFKGKKIRFIIGVLKDKDYETMLRYILPYGAEAYCVTPNNKRGLDAKILAETAKRIRKLQKKQQNEQQHVQQNVQQAEIFWVKACESVKEALYNALNASDEEDIILAFGSLSYLAEVREAYYEICGSTP